MRAPVLAAHNETLSCGGEPEFRRAGEHPVSNGVCDDIPALPWSLGEGAPQCRMPSRQRLGDCTCDVLSGGRLVSIFSKVARHLPLRLPFVGAAYNLSRGLGYEAFISPIDDGNPSLCARATTTIVTMA